MEKITVLEETRSISNLQKLYISNKVLSSSSHGKFAKITTRNETFYLCQIFLSKVLHPSFCNIDTSVYGYKTSGVKNLYPTLRTVNAISLSDIIVLSSVANIKSMVVSVVFDTPEIANKWRGQSFKLNELVKNLLKPFVVQSGSVVSLDGLRTLFDCKVYCLLIEGTGNINTGRVVGSTKVKLNQVISRETYCQIYTVIENLPAIGGLDGPIKTLTQLMKFTTESKDKSHPPVYKQALILGPTGCGKTALVHHVARNCRLVLRTVVGPEICLPLPGEAEAALTAIFDECRLLALESLGGCVLLLQDVESLCGRKDGSTPGHLIRVANQLFTLLEKVNTFPGLMVIGTSNRPHNIDPAVRRPGRFDHEIHIGVSNESERVSILQTVTRQQGLCDILCDQVAQWTPGFVGADLALLATNMVRHLKRIGLPSSFDEVDELTSHWHSCVCKQQPSALKGQLGVMLGVKAYCELGGVDYIRRNLAQFIEWPISHPDVFRRMGLPNPKGVLLYGPPGCAKTSLVRAIAATTNTTFLAVSAAQIYSPYVGDAERTIAELFHRARLGAPSILFIDEIDALVGCRGDRERGSQERILTSFLTEMDGIGVQLDSGTTQAGVVVVVAATNRPDMLDPALKRPGRFDRLIYVGPPDGSQRLDILRAITKKMPLAADVDLTQLAQATDLYSGADLSQLCKEAGLCALSQEGMSVTEVSQRHWLTALNSMRPSLSPEQVLYYEGMASACD